jgi:two-component system OmpR family response regulator/two-component system response regulator QseB
MRILLVEDDQPLGRGLTKGLEQNGFAVDWVQDGQAGLREGAQTHYGAIVLDLGLPQVTGMNVLSGLRAQGVGTPVLILTAHDHLDSRVQGLDLGADDYMVKPIDIRELSARLRAAIRRGQGLAHPAFSIGQLMIDPAKREATWSGQGLDLTPREFDVLQVLALGNGRVLTRGQIEQQMTSWGQTIESNAVEVHIHHLRKKMPDLPLKTIRGVGYQLLDSHA